MVKSSNYKNWEERCYSCHYPHEMRNHRPYDSSKNTVTYFLFEPMRNPSNDHISPRYDDLRYINVPIPFKRYHALKKSYRVHAGTSGVEPKRKVPLVLMQGDEISSDVFHNLQWLCFPTVPASTSSWQLIQTVCGCYMLTVFPGMNREPADDGIFTPYSATGRILCKHRSPYGLQGSILVGIR